MRKLVLSVVSLLVIVSFLAGCATPAPQVVEKVVTQVVEVEKEVKVVETQVVETIKEVEKIVVATPEPTAVPVVDANTLPRNETLYFNGQQWNAVVGWNPYSNSNNNAMATAQQDNARVIMFETPYLYNMIDGKQYPLLADGDYAWN